jgi:putative oxidoreductase
MSLVESFAPLAGRFVLAWYFLAQAYRYALDWNNTAILLSMRNMPVPPVLLAGAVAATVLGSLSLVLGFRARIGGCVLLLVTLGLTVTLHDFWHIRAAVARNADYDIFARNVAIAGGLLLMIGMGAGPLALDNLGGKRGRRKSR